MSDNIVTSLVLLCHLDRGIGDLGQYHRVSRSCLMPPSILVHRSDVSLTRRRHPQAEGLAVLPQPPIFLSRVRAACGDAGWSRVIVPSGGSLLFGRTATSGSSLEGLGCAINRISVLMSGQSTEPLWTYTRHGPPVHANILMPQDSTATRLSRSSTSTCSSRCSGFADRSGGTGGHKGQCGIRPRRMRSDDHGWVAGITRTDPIGLGDLAGVRGGESQSSPICASRRRTRRRFHT